MNVKVRATPPAGGIATRCGPCHRIDHRHCQGPPCACPQCWKDEIIATARRQAISGTGPRELRAALAWLVALELSRQAVAEAIRRKGPQFRGYCAWCGEGIVTHLGRPRKYCCP